MEPQTTSVQQLSPKKTLNLGREGSNLIRTEKIRDKDVADDKILRQMDKDLAKSDQMIAQLNHQLEKMRERAFQWEQKARGLEEYINELMAQNDQKNRQLAACIQDLEDEKRSKIESKRKALESKINAEDEMQKLQEEIDRLKIELTSGQELVSAAVEERELQRINEQANQQLLEEQKKFNNDLKKENSALVKKMAIKEETFQAESAALKKARNYYKSAAEKNKQRRVFDEYVIAKKAEIETKNMKKIEDNERSVSRSFVDRIKEKLTDVLDLTKKEMDKANSDNMTKVRRETVKDESEAIAKGQTLMKEDPEGKVDCPECDLNLSGIPTLTHHLKDKHDVSLAMPSKK